jgi:pyruvate dehydrogenase E2 component (dihydrolipoamide acetyltransferase)
VVKELKVALGDKVKQGSSVMVTADAPAPLPARRLQPRPWQRPRCAAALRPPRPRCRACGRGPIEVRVPDIGDFKDVAVIELLVKVGDTVKAEQSLFTVESDKASMEILARRRRQGAEGQVGDKVNVGDVVGQMRCRALPRRCAAAAPAPAAAALRRHSGPGRWPRRAAAPRSCRCPTTPPWRPPAAAARIALGAQVRPRTGRAAGRGQGQRPQGPHHGRRRAGLHQAR